LQTVLTYSASLLTFAALACAADVTGAWNMTARTPDGYKHESTLNLQAGGGKLTGKIVSRRGTVEIANGLVDGNNISFTVVRAGNGDELKIEFQGTVEGDTMKLRMQYRDHDPVELIGRRGAISEHK
jgi:hypothetical protein